MAFAAQRGDTLDPGDTPLPFSRPRRESETHPGARGNPASRLHDSTFEMSQHTQHTDSCTHIEVILGPFRGPLGKVNPLEHNLQLLEGPFRVTRGHPDTAV